ncbi:MAG: hypothetical protein MAG794_01171 [Gammaproteobacteria bacterium]|nr:hypothetical protein [Gammaproteobacteria bacterium]
MNGNETFNDCRRIEYRQLMTRLAEAVGRHQLPVKTDATDINDILDGDPVHYGLVHEVVRAIYRSGRCHTLDAEVRAETVFNSLGGVRGRLLAERETDIDQINLLEELGWASRVLFAAPPPSGETCRPESDAGSDG